MRIILKNLLGGIKIPITIVNEENLDPKPPQYAPKFEFGGSGKKDTYSEPVNYLKRASWWQKIFYRFRKNKTILVNMELTNGYSTTFIVFVKENSFKFRGKRYIIDNSLFTEHLPTGLFMLDYHEEISIPIKRRINVNELRQTISASKMLEIELALNPAVIDTFIDSKIQDQILRGGLLDIFLRQVRLLVVIGIIVGGIHLILYAAKSGVFSSIKF